MVLQPNEPERKKPSETENSSESLPDFAFEAKDISPFAEAISDFDRSQERMREIFLSIAESDTQTEANHTEITANIEETLRAFAISAHMIIRDTPDDRLRDTTLVHLIQGGEANRHQLIADVDPENTTKHEKFDTKTIRDEVELAFFESHSEAEKIERLTSIFYDMTGYDIQVLFDRINELQAKKFEPNPTEETETLPDNVHPLMKRRFGRRAMASAALAAGTGGALFAQLMNLRF